MKSLLFALLSIVFSTGRAYLVSPPGAVAPGTTSECSNWVGYNSLWGCENIEVLFGITAAEFEAWNPIVTELSDGCTIAPGLYYCVQINFETSTVTASSSPSTSSPSTIITTTTPTTTGNGISTPTPYQTGMASNCDKFYLVVKGDECGTISSNEGINLADFYSWNPAVSTSCQYLDLGDYVCVGIETCTSTSCSVTTTATSTTPTATGNGIPTPTPYQTSMASNCDNFHLVVSGDECDSIASNEGISLADFYSWNPAVGTSCQYLDLGYYVCIGVETCTSASILSAPSQGGLTCGAPGASHDNSGSLLIKSYTGSPYVDSAAACGAQCLATPSCTNLYFIEGSYCNLHEGTGTWALSTELGYYLWYEAACFSQGSCGALGASHDNSGSLLIESYTGSPYVDSAAACGAQCLATPSCTNIYFIEGSYCNLHEGASTFASNATSSYLWYDASCFSSGEVCGSYGLSDDVSTTILVSYTSGSAYVESATVCGAQCLSTSDCTNVYFMEGSYCNLHSPSTFKASSASGYYEWYQAGCFACNALS